MPLFFVKGSLPYRTVFAAHYVAIDRANALAIAQRDYENGKEMARKWGIDVFNVDPTEWTAKPSKADAASMALNCPGNSSTRKCPRQRWTGNARSLAKWTRTRRTVSGFASVHGAPL